MSGGKLTGCLSMPDGNRARHPAISNGKQTQARSQLPGEHFTGKQTQARSQMPGEHFTSRVQPKDNTLASSKKHFSVMGRSGQTLSEQFKQRSSVNSELVNKTVPFQLPDLSRSTSSKKLSGKGGCEVSRTNAVSCLNSSLLDSLNIKSSSGNNINNIKECDDGLPFTNCDKLLELNNVNLFHIMPQVLDTPVQKVIHQRKRKLKVIEQSEIKVKQNPRQVNVKNSAIDLLTLSNYRETSQGVTYSISWDSDESLVPQNEKVLDDINLIFDEDFCETDFIEGAKSNIKDKIKTENDLERGSDRFFKNKSEFYDNFMNALYSDSPCSYANCENPSDVTCTTCGPLCQSHDVDRHCAATDHERFYGIKRLDPGLTTDGKCFKKFPITIPVNDSMKYKQCTICQTRLTIVPNKDSTVKVVGLNGVFVANTITFLCPGCNVKRPMVLEEYFQNSLFPINCDPNGNVVATFTILQFWGNLKNGTGSLGEGVFLNSVNRNGTCILNQMEFDLLYQQWRHLLFLHSQDVGENYRDCPAKLSSSTRIHTDGLLKLNRFNSKNHRTTKQTSYFGNAIIVDPEEVRATVKIFKEHGYVSGGNSQCGTSHWTAAENREKSSPLIAETGMVLTTCSHYHTLSGVDMERGEIYALNNVAITDVKRRGYNVTEANLDIACKYKGWQSRVNADKKLIQNLPYDPSVKCKMCVGDFHSKGHSTWCRVNNAHKWNGNGTASGGEQTEVLNSPLAQLRHRVRFMKSVRRRDEITEFILERNKDRDETMVSEIIVKLEQFEKELDKIDSNLSHLTTINKINVNEDLIEILKESAQKITSSNKSDAQEKIEFYIFSLLSKRAEWKSTVDLGLRLKVKGNIDSVTKKLTTEIEKYNQENDADITFENALEGFLPWTVRHLPETIRNNPAVFLKGAELYLKKQRIKEEIKILNEDLVIIIMKRERDIEKLMFEIQSTTQSKSLRKAKAFKAVLLKEQMKYEVRALKFSKIKKSEEQISLLKDFADLGANLKEKVHPSIDFISLIPEDLNFSFDLNPPRCSTPITNDSLVSDETLVESVSVQLETVNVQERRSIVQAERGSVPAERGDVQAERGDVQAERGDVQAERGAVHAERGDVHAERGDVQAERGSIQAERGDVQAERGALRVERRPVQVMRGAIQAERCDVQAVKATDQQQSEQAITAHLPRQVRINFDHCKADGAPSSRRMCPIKYLSSNSVKCDHAVIQDRVIFREESANNISSICSLSEPSTILGGTVHRSEANRRREIFEVDTVEKSNSHGAREDTQGEEEPREKRRRASSVDSDDKNNKQK